MKINCPGTTRVGKVEAIDRNPESIRGSGEPPLPNVRAKDGFALVVALIMVALAAVIAVGVLTTVSVERNTATSYNSRYQADLAVQNGLQAAAKTLVATPNGTNAITGKDTFLVVRADGGSPGASYYYLGQVSGGTSPTITYYPLFSTLGPSPTPQPINLRAQDAPSPQYPTKPFAPLVQPPSPPADSSSGDPTAAWNAAKTQRMPSLYSWQQPSPSPSGPSVQWVEMRDPQDPQGPYTRYAYWVEDLDGYLDASQVSHPNGVAARFSGASTWTDNANPPVVHYTGTSAGEIGMFTIFQSDQLGPNPAPGPVANLVGSTEAETQNKRSLVLTVPTLQQLAQPQSDVAGPNLAVRLGADNNPGEQNLIPLGYGYGSEGQTKAPINPITKLRGNITARFAAPIRTAMPSFDSRTLGGTLPGGHGHTQTVNYFNNLAANLFDYAFPSQAPTDFAPPGNPDAPPASRGIGAYPLVVSLYDLNNWVQTYSSGGTWKIVVEVTTYVQLWNPHHSTDPNNPSFPVKGLLKLTYNNSDQVQLTNATPAPTPFQLSAPPDTNVIFTDNPTRETDKPVITSPLSATGKPGQLFQYQIVAGNGRQFPALQSDAYQVVKMPGPPIHPITSYGASGLPPGLSLGTNQNSLGLISGRPRGGVGTYNVTISATNSYGTATATLVITITN